MLTSSSPEKTSPTAELNKPTITIAKGDGIGPEIMDATLNILEAAGATLDYEEIHIGEAVYRQGMKSGISPESWDTLRRNKVFLKAPITTPQGGGYKSLNVTIRKSLGLFANVRPCRALTPFVDSHFPEMDLVVVRENEEDLYAGIEHQQTGEVVQCLKLITRPGTEKVVRYAFEYARANGRKKVTCMTKDNIMKHTDGLFHEVFEEVANEYPDIESEHLIIDIGAALLADDPHRFDVVVTLNLYGDIISDITAQVAGSVGIGGSSNIGRGFAMFEAIHGSAPDIAGKGIANPSGLLNAACMMLVHIGQAEVAETIQNAWLCTLEDGIHTGDIASEIYTKKRVGTREFAQAVIDRLGRKPKTLDPVHFRKDIGPIELPEYHPRSREKTLVGVDAFIDWNGKDFSREPDRIGAILEEAAAPDFRLKMITNRGVKVYPEGLPETFCTDHWRCRFVAAEGRPAPVTNQQIIGLLQRLDEHQMDVIKTENLYEVEGKRAYSLGQGE